MTLTRTQYACSKCGRLQEVTTRKGELPPRRCTRRCLSRKCRRRPRLHHPARYPITGRWAG